jgi:hypothetical protein
MTARDKARADRAVDLMRRYNQLGASLPNVRDEIDIAVLHDAGQLDVLEMTLKEMERTQREIEAVLGIKVTPARKRPR